MSSKEDTTEYLGDFSIAVTLLGAMRTCRDGEAEPNMEARLGAILALSRLAERSPEACALVVDTLCAYIRLNATWDDQNPPQRAAKDIPPDIQTALKEVGKLPTHIHGVQIDLTRTDLRGAVLWAAGLDGSILARTNLEMSDLGEAGLRGAALMGANLAGSILWKADLRDAQLWGANLRRASLAAANLANANLAHADLRGAVLTSANLEGATLVGAKLEGARLDGVVGLNARDAGADDSGPEVEDRSLHEAT